MNTQQVTEQVAEEENIDVSSKRVKTSKYEGYNNSSASHQITFNNNNKLVVVGGDNKVAVSNTNKIKFSINGRNVQHDVEKVPVHNITFNIKNRVIFNNATKRKSRDTKQKSIQKESKSKSKNRGTSKGKNKNIIVGYSDESIYDTK